MNIYIFRPKKDITAYELALVLRFSLATTANSTKEYERLLDSAKRHLEVVIIDEKPLFWKTLFNKITNKLKGKTYNQKTDTDT